MLLKRCVCIRQAGRALASAPLTHHHLSFLLMSIYRSFTPGDFSNLKLSPPHQRVRSCQMGPEPANRTTATPATSYQYALPSSPEQLGYFKAGLSSCVPSRIYCRAAVIFMDVTHCRTTCSPWPGSPLEGALCQGQIIQNPS